MTLRRKLLVMYVVIGTLVLLLMGTWMYATFRRNQIRIIEKNINNQLELIDFSRTNFFKEVEHDVQALAKMMSVKRGFGFHKILQPSTYRYNIGELEQNIINVLNNYRMTHPYVNSVYMGRENGSFVRSHLRNQPSQYDPPR